MNLTPEIWGPSFWFFLHTIAFHYPLHPNDFIKKKYFDFISHFYLFIPVEQISKEFNQLLDLYPVSPYLDSREAFISWTHFIHNKINEKLEKPPITLNDFFVKYYNEYKSQNEKLAEFYKLREKLIYGGIVISILGGIYYLYDK